MIFNLIQMANMFFDAIKSFHPDLILMDVMLDDMDGRLIGRNIKEKSEAKRLPVILISASHDLSLVLNQKGAPNDFVSKPFDIDYLLKKVEQYFTDGSDKQAFINKQA